MKNTEILSSTIRQMIELKGISVFGDSKIFCAMIDDLAPQLVTERRIFHRVLNDELLKEIGEIQNSGSEQSQNIAWEKIERKLINYYGLREEWCRTLVRGFSDAFKKGYSDYCISANEKSVSQKNILPRQHQKAVEQGNIKKLCEDDVHLQRIGSNIRIVMIGIGGAGNNTINRAIDEQIGGIEFIAINADQDALQLCKAPKLIQVGEKLCKGLGVAAKPELGEKAAEESIEEIRAAIKGASIVFICCGMGGGMGTGGAPVVARIAKEMGIMTVGFVTKPFRFEAKARYVNAISGIENLRKYMDALFVIPNDIVLEVVDRNATMPEALRMIDKVIFQGVIGIRNLVDPYTINFKSFAELQKIMEKRGFAHIGYSTAKGKGKIIVALRMAIDSPWLENSIKDAAQVFLHLAGDISGLDISYAVRHIQGVIGHINVIYGAKYDKDMPDEVTVTVIVFDRIDQTINCKNSIEEKSLKIPGIFQKREKEEEVSHKILDLPQEKSEEISDEKGVEKDAFDNIITLTDENGYDVRFDFLDLIEYRGKEYVVLLPEHDGKGEVVILQVEYLQGDLNMESYVSVGDESVLNKIFDIFKQRFKDELNFED